jgi:hypothetical protein
MLGPISRMEVNRPQPLAAMRLRNALRRSIDTLRSPLRELSPPSSSPSAANGRQAMAPTKENSDHADQMQGVDADPCTLAVLKRDYYALLQECEDHLDALPNILPGSIPVQPTRSVPLRLIRVI